MQLGQSGELERGNRQRVEAVVQTLAALGCRGESLAEVAHDARNMVTALGLYCDLLEEPGVLAVAFAHYGSELRLVAAASRRLVEKLVALDARSHPEAALRVCGISAESEAAHGGVCIEAAEEEHGADFGSPTPLSLAGSLDSGVGGLNAIRNVSAVLGSAAERGRRSEAAFAESIENLAAELQANHNLLSALAGPGIAVTVETEGGARPVRLSAEDLTRLLVNLVRNAAEAMSSGGQIRISLHEHSRQNGPGAWVSLAVEDNGPGIAPSALPRIFDSGFTTRSPSPRATGGWPALHRGLGLAISRSIVESAGGRIQASNRMQGGARFEIELPVRTP
jgi:signal transduction histidine kinase